MPANIVWLIDKRKTLYHVQECPGCQVENRKILDIIKSQEAGRSQHDQFHAQVGEQKDPKDDPNTGSKGRIRI